MKRRLAGFIDDLATRDRLLSVPTSAEHYPETCADQSALWLPSDGFAVSRLDMSMRARLNETRGVIAPFIEIASPRSQ
jgi:hypothetical protein